MMAIFEDLTLKTIGELFLFLVGATLVVIMITRAIKTFLS